MNTAQAVLQGLGLVTPQGKKGLLDCAKKLASLCSVYRKLRKYL